MSKNIELMQLTVKSLREGKEGLSQFKKVFEEISDLFESGDDTEALQSISDVTQNLNDFALFCGALQQNCSFWLTESELTPLNDAGNKFEKLLTDMVNETEERNFIEVGDILRYDLSDLMDEYSPIFTKISTSVEEKLCELNK